MTRLQVLITYQILAHESSKKKGIASSSGWKFKSAKLELKSSCTSLIIKLNHRSEQTASGHDKFSYHLASLGEDYPFL